MKAILMALLMVFSFTVVGCGDDKPADKGTKTLTDAEKAAAKKKADAEAAKKKAEADAKAKADAAAKAAEDAKSN